MSKLKIFLAGALALGLTACYEPSEVTVHEPGVYKGERDDLMAKSADQRREELIARFNRVQRDR